MAYGPLSFGKKEKLCAQKLSQHLFAEGIGCLKYPVRVIFSVCSLPEPVPCQVMVSVSKKKFKKAHDRNRVKRQLRESFRQHKEELYRFLTDHHIQISMAVVYIPSEHLPFPDIDKGISKALAKVREVLVEKGLVPASPILAQPGDESHF